MEKLKIPRKPDLRQLNYESQILRKDAQNMRQYWCLFHRGFRLSWLSIVEKRYYRKRKLCCRLDYSITVQWRVHDIIQYSGSQNFFYSPDIITCCEEWRRRELLIWQRYRSWRLA